MLAIKVSEGNERIRNVIKLNDRKGCKLSERENVAKVYQTQKEESGH